MSNWKPINELPRDSIKYLKVLYTYNIGGNKRTEYGYYMNGVFYDMYDNIDEVKAYATHWMPLPSPYSFN